MPFLFFNYQFVKDLLLLNFSKNKKVRTQVKLIKNNPISLNIFQMVMSIIIMAFLVLELFCLSVMISDKSSSLWITVLVIIYAVITLCFWVMSIYELALIDYDNYIHDCLLLLPLDSKNQRSYYTIIERQLRKHLANNDVYRFNDDLIQIAKFIAKEKSNQFIYYRDLCIDPLFYSNNEIQYLKSITSTYDIDTQGYSYSKEPTTSDDKGFPEERITTFQGFLFSSKSYILDSFLENVVQVHVKLEKSSQHELINYYLWALDGLCVNKNNYSFIFALDIIRAFKSRKDARKFLLDAMKIALYRQNNDAARGLYRGYLIFLAEHGVSNYIKLKKNDGGTAWLFNDLIHLTMVNYVLNDSELNRSDIMFKGFNRSIFDITNKSSVDKDIFLEWVAFIYCHNRIARLKIKENDFISGYPKTPVFDIINEECAELLRQILDNNPIEIQNFDACTSQFTRAIDDRDFWGNVEIKATNYHKVLHEVLNGK